MNLATSSPAVSAALAKLRQKRRLVLRKFLELLAVRMLPFAIVLTIGVALAFQGTDCRTENFAESKVRFLEAALLHLKIDHGFTPTETQGLEVLVTKLDDPRLNDWHPYLKSEALVDYWGNKIQYRNPGTHNPNSYDVFSFGPDGIQSADDIGNW